MYYPFVNNSIFPPINWQTLREHCLRKSTDIAANQITKVGLSITITLHFVTVGGRLTTFNNCQWQYAGVCVCTIIILALL